MVICLAYISGLWFPKEMTTQLFHEVALLNATVDVISCGFNLDVPVKIIIFLVFV